MSQTHNDRSTEQGAKVNSMDGQEGATLAPPAFKLTAAGQNPGGNPGGGTAQLKDGPTSAKAVAQMKSPTPEEFFAQYEAQTQRYLDFFYDKNASRKDWKEKMPDYVLTGSDFAVAAKAVYDDASAKDLSKIAPAELAVAQCLNEGGMTPEKESSFAMVNPFNVAITDGGKKGKEAQKLDKVKKEEGWAAARKLGIIAYYKLMYNTYMGKAGSTEKMLEYDGFNSAGNKDYAVRYATAFNYEARMTASIGLMHMNDDGKLLSGTVGDKKGNAVEDLKAVYTYIQSYDKFPNKLQPSIIYADLVKLKDEVPTVESISAALLSIQNNEIAPEESTFSASKSKVAKNMKATAPRDYAQQVDSRKNIVDGTAGKHGTTIGFLYYHHELVTEGKVFGNSPAVAYTGSPASGKPDFDAIAKECHDAMFAQNLAWIADAPAVYAALGKLKQNQKYIDTFKATYKRKYSADIEADLTRGLSEGLFGDRRAKALELLNAVDSTGMPAATTKTAAQKGTVTASTLKVRSGPGPENALAGPALASNTKVDILESKNGWLRIGEGKWVSAEFVKVDGQASTGNSAKTATPGGKKAEWDFKKLSDDLDKVLSMTGFKEPELYKVISELPKNSAEAAAFIEFYNSVHNGDLAKELQKQLQGEALQKAIEFLDITKAFKPESSKGGSTKESSKDGAAKAEAKPAVTTKAKPLAKDTTTAAKPMPVSARAAVTISASVGSDGENTKADVMKIQQLLSDIGYIVGIDGGIGKNTIGAIASFQEASGIASDGKVDPEGTTLSLMNSTANGAFVNTAENLKDDKDAPSLTHAKWTNKEHFATDTEGVVIPRQHYANMNSLITNMITIADNLTGTFNVNSGYRSPHYNSTLEGSAAQSNHQFGRAVDIKASDYTPKKLKAALEKLIADGKIHDGGIGLYGWGCHYDIDNSRRW